MKGPLTRLNPTSDDLLPLEPAPALKLTPAHGMFGQTEMLEMSVALLALKMENVLGFAEGCGPSELRIR